MKLMQLRESCLHAEKDDLLGLVTQYRARFYPRVLMTRKKWPAASGKSAVRPEATAGHRIAGQSRCDRQHYRGHSSPSE